MQLLQEQNTTSKLQAEIRKLKLQLTDSEQSKIAKQLEDTKTELSNTGGKKFSNTGFPCNTLCKLMIELTFENVNVSGSTRA